jgi:hypothetical protein
MFVRISWIELGRPGSQSSSFGKLICIFVVRLFSLSATLNRLGTEYLYLAFDGILHGAF